MRAADRSARPAVADAPASVSPFAPTERVCADFRDLGDAALVRSADRWWEIDVAASRAYELALPPVELVSIARRAPHLAIVGRTENVGLELYERRGGAWKHHPLPDPIRGVDSNTAELVASREATVVLTPSFVATRRRDAWACVAVDVRSFHSSNRQWRAVRSPWGAPIWCLASGALWIANQRGEFGGDLNALDLATGRWSEPIEGLGEPGYGVLEMTFPRAVVDGPTGEPWIVEGLAHLSLHHGKLSRRHGSTWVLETGVRGGGVVLGETTDGAAEVVGPSKAAPPSETWGDWNLGWTTFDALAFDRAGAPCLLTSELGLVRREHDGWRRLTPSWPRDTTVLGLAVLDDVAVIATKKNGVTLCDLRDGSLRGVEFDAR